MSNPSGASLPSGTPDALGLCTASGRWHDSAHRRTLACRGWVEQPASPPSPTPAFAARCTHCAKLLAQHFGEDHLCIEGLVDGPRWSPNQPPSPTTPAPVWKSDDELVADLPVFATTPAPRCEACKAPMTGVKAGIVCLTHGCPHFNEPIPDPRSRPAAPQGGEPGVTNRPSDACLLATMQDAFRGCPVEGDFPAPAIDATLAVLHRFDALRAALASSPAGAQTESITNYESAARSIALNLDEFCNAELPYPAMIADAARKASRETESLRAASGGAPSGEPDGTCRCVEHWPRWSALDIKRPGLHHFPGCPLSTDPRDIAEMAVAMTAEANGAPPGCPLYDTATGDRCTMKAHHSDHCHFGASSPATGRPDV